MLPRRRLLRAALLALLLSFLGARSVTRASEAPPFFPPGADYDPAVATTERILAYSIGEKSTDNASLQTYLQALSRDATRIVQRTYGKTVEGRALRYLIISHPDNLARLEKIRSDSLRLSDPRTLPAAEAAQIARSNPAIVWLAYSVHGDEHSSTEAALATAYHLAAARDEGTVRMLRDVVVIIDPVQNPDGRERFLDYERQVSGPDPKSDPYALEHDEPWPSGRFNHYLFDLNRDWFLQTQTETQAKVKAFLDWMPQVYVDLHEMSSDATYFFPPPAEPINRNVPDSIRKWWNLFGMGNATAFDRAGLDYYTAESFDGYYPGYGDSWPALHGSIGMTYEQASARGLAVERKDGSILTLREAARHHFTASLATIATAAAQREALLNDTYAYRRDSIAAGEAGPARAYLIPPTVPSTAARLAALLASEGVEVRRADGDFQTRAQGYDGSEATTRRFPAGTFVVPLAQPASRLATALMELDPFMPPKFLAEEQERRRLKEDSAIYDVTAWSLPLAIGADAFWTAETVKARTEAVDPNALAPACAVTAIGPSAGAPGTAGAGGARASYAYLLKYYGNAAARALVSLLRTEIKVKAAGRPFRIGAESFPAGSLVLRVHGNPESLHDIVRKEAETFGVTFHAVSTGLTDEGPDLGSGSVVPVSLPKVAVAFAEPTSPPSAGAIAWLFEAEYGLPYTPLRTASLPDSDLARYNVIILPDASGSPGYREYLGESGIKRLKSWIEGGGTLVTIKRASAFAAGKEVDLASVRRRMKPTVKPASPADPNAAEADASLEGEPPDLVPGAILRTIIEPTHYLAFGYGKEGSAMVNSNLVLSTSKDGRNVVTFASKERLRLGGFAWQESLDLLAGSAYLVEEPRGRGRVILFADDPNFRGCWESLTRMFLNSVIFAPAFGEGG